MGYKDVFLPKPHDEIWEAIHELSPDEMLSKCVRGGFLPGVIIAIKQGATVNPNDYRESFVSIALKLRYYDIAMFLIRKGAYYHDLTMASALDNDEIFKLMLINLPPNRCNHNFLEILIMIAKSRGLNNRIVQIEKRINENIIAS